jgi:hypothetical protein
MINTPPLLPIFVIIFQSYWIMAEYLLNTALAQLRSGDLRTAYETLWVACHAGPLMVEVIADTSTYDLFIDVLPAAHRNAIHERRHRCYVQDTVDFQLINTSLICEEAINDAEEEQQRWMFEQEEEQLAMQWVHAALVVP